MRESTAEFMNRRADQEMRLAQEATDQRVAAAHYELACRYLIQIYPDASRQLPDQL